MSEACKHRVSSVLAHHLVLNDLVDAQAKVLDPLLLDSEDFGHVALQGDKVIDVLQILNNRILRQVLVLPTVLLATANLCAGGFYFL